MASTVRRPAIFAAFTEPKKTMSAEASALKLAPVIVIGVPLLPDTGVKEVMIGTVVKVKPGAVAVPLGEVTLMSPLAPEPTTAVMVAISITVYEAAGKPPKLTAEMPEKLAPFRVMLVPGPPISGEKEVISGPVKSNPPICAVPYVVVTATLPEFPGPTTAVIVLSEVMVKEVAGTPPKLTAVAASKLAPVMTTVVPA